MVVDDADDQLDSPRRHRLHDEPIEPVAGPRDRLLDLAGGGAHRVRAFNAEPDPAGVGLVHEPRGARLQRDRCPELDRAATASSASSTTRVVIRGSP